MGGESLLSIDASLLVDGRTFPLKSLGRRTKGSADLLGARETGGRDTFGLDSEIGAKSRFNSGRLGMIEVEGLVRRAVGFGGIEEDLEITEDK